MAKSFKEGGWPERTATFMRKLCKCDRACTACDGQMGQMANAGSTLCPSPTHTSKH